MATHRHIDRICVFIILCAIVITAIFMNSESMGVLAVSGGAGYGNRLFDTSQVHTIDIVMEDWEDFIENCENEEYVQCAAVIDGEAFKNVGIRAKGNTSLSSVSSMGSDRYSFKLEFDHYDSGQSYFGLDKLSLNNLIQDTTFMKDYLTYQMMGNFGVDAPLCSYAYITVNGQDWGLYLAVEGVEEAFLQRNYGNDYGNLYKPDSSDFGGGPGNGRDFKMDEFMGRSEEAGEDFPSGNGGIPREDFPPGNEGMSGGDFPPGNGGMPGEGFPPEFHDKSGEGFGLPPADNADGKGMPDSGGATDIEQPVGDQPDRGPSDQERGGEQHGGGRQPGGMGSSDVKLQYIDDDPDSYPNIFDSAKTDVRDADKARLISSLKALDEGEEIEKVVDVEEVLRYFVVHNFVCNGDSYTGSIVHNYYLYEEDGQLSMIPWDYNLAFGTFQSQDATSMVNSPIDTPTENSDSRPMVDWIFEEEAYTQQYHQYFAEFLESTDLEGMIDATAELIAPYVEKDPTKFYSSEEFEAGVAALKEFCRLRKESVEGQLTGDIPSTDSGQAAESSALVDASHLGLSDMGTMDNGRHGGFGPGERPEAEQREKFPGRMGK